MSYIALYRKHRPKLFEEIVEQQPVVKALKNSIINGRISHAYLFCGTRGTGKTSMAHIFARAVNCLNPNDGNPCNQCEICLGIFSGSIMDVLEIDAASNNSVEDVRNIREEVVYIPSRTKYRVYIIDEVHMLSTGAFNALLKTLEEPPSHVIFILATTEPHKLPATILSRCQRYDFKKLTASSIEKRLYNIAQDDQLSIDSKALNLIARLADGAMRDALSILDQCVSLGSSFISYEDVLSLTGIVNTGFTASLVSAILDNDILSINTHMETLSSEGKDISFFISELIKYVRNLLIFNITKQYELIDAPSDILDMMRSQSETAGRDNLIFIINSLSGIDADMKWSSHPLILLEVALIKICRDITENQASLTERVATLERKINSFQRFDNKDSSNINSPVKKEYNKNEPPTQVNKKSTPVNNAILNQKPLAVWEDVLQEIKIKKRALHASLSTAYVFDKENGIIEIFFPEPSNISLDFVSMAENISLIKEIIQKLLNQRVEVIIKKTQSKEQKDNNKDSSDIRIKALNEAQKLNVPFNEIDE